MLLLNSCVALYLYLTTCAAVRNAQTGFSHQLLRNATGAPTNSSKLYLPSANEVRIQIPNASPGTTLILYNIKQTYLHGPAMTAILFTHLHYILHVILEFGHGDRRVPLDEYNIEQGGILGLLKVDIHGLEGGPLWYGQVADVLAGLEAYAQRTNLWAAMWILVVDALPTANGFVDWLPPGPRALN